MAKELRIPSSQREIQHTLSRSFGLTPRLDSGVGANTSLIRLMSTPPTYPAVIAGADSLMFAVSNLSGRPLANETISLGTRVIPEKDKNYMRERRGAAIGLQDVLDSISPRIEEAAQTDPLLRGMKTDELLASRYDAVRVLTNYAAHADAFADSLRDIGIADSDAYISRTVTERDIHAAALVDAAIGSWLLRHVEDTGLPRESIIMTREGSHAHGITRTLEEKDVVADIAVNQIVVPSLNRILAMDPLARDYMLNLFKNVSRFNHVYVVHTHKDADNLNDIANYKDDEHARIPLEERAVVTVRNLVPPQYLEVAPSEFETEQAAPFMREAVAEGKIILGIIGRLDPIKRDLTVLKRINELVSQLSGSAEGREILQNLRIAVVAKPKVFDGNYKVGKMMTQYHDKYEELVSTVNDNYKEVMGAEDDFIIVNRDSSGELAGMSVTDLKDQVFPYLNICLQMGQEGLNVVIQEAAIQTTFGLEVPRPVVGILAHDTGFSEKVKEHDLCNFLIVDDPQSSDEVTSVLIEAYQRAMAIKENPGSSTIAEISGRLRGYYEEACADSYFGEPLAILVSLRGVHRGYSAGVYPEN